MFGLVAAIWVAAVAGCSGAGAEGDGGAGGGGGGAAGGGSPTKTLTCPTGVTEHAKPVDPESVAAVTGDNGTFIDHCDGSGNLVEYTCEDEVICSDFCEPILTGQVIENVIDCKGTCQAGACDRGCPDPGVALTVVSSDATGTTLHDAASGTKYTCVHATDSIPNDAWPCSGAEAVGKEGKVHHPVGWGFCNQGEGAFYLAFPSQDGNCLYRDCTRSN